VLQTALLTWLALPKSITFTLKKSKTWYYFMAMLWIRIGFNADPDTGSQTNADPSGSGSWPDFSIT
jgi:hypothetical protein